MLKNGGLRFTNTPYPIPVMVKVVKKWSMVHLPTTSSPFLDYFMLKKGVLRCFFCLGRFALIRWTVPMRACAGLQNPGINMADLKELYPYLFRDAKQALGIDRVAGYFISLELKCCNGSYCTPFSEADLALKATPHPDDNQSKSAAPDMAIFIGKYTHKSVIIQRH